jgi:hypothetical protein
MKKTKKEKKEELRVLIEEGLMLSIKEEVKQLNSTLNLFIRQLIVSYFEHKNMKFDKVDEMKEKISSMPDLVISKLKELFEEQHIVQVISQVKPLEKLNNPEVPVPLDRQGIRVQDGRLSRRVVPEPEEGAEDNVPEPVIAIGRMVNESVKNRSGRPDTIEIMKALRAKRRGDEYDVSMEQYFGDLKLDG